jgi:hypothetical protein
MPADDQKEFRIAVPISNMYQSGTGTFTKITAQNNSGVSYLSKTAATGTFYNEFEIPGLPIVQAEYGVDLLKIEVPVRIATQNLNSAPIFSLYRESMVAVTGGGTNITASSVGITVVDTGTFLATDRLFTITVTSPASDFGITDPAYTMSCKFNCGTSTVLRLYKPRVYYITLS